MDTGSMNGIVRVTSIKDDCPLVFIIKNGYQRYSLNTAFNKKGERFLYFSFGAGSESAIKDDGSFMDYEEFKDIPVAWYCGLAINSSSQAEKIEKMFHEAARFLREQEEKDIPKKEE